MDIDHTQTHIHTHWEIMQESVSIKPKFMALIYWKSKTITLSNRNYSGKDKISLKTDFKNAEIMCVCLRKWIYNK